MLIKAIQEQQEIIENQNSKITAQDDKYASLEKMGFNLASIIEGENATVLVESTLAKK